MLTETQKSVIESIARRKGLVSFSLSVQRACKKGDNYLGDVFSVDLKGENKTLSYILKCADPSPSVRAHMPLNDAAFQEAKGAKHPFEAYASLLASSTQEGAEFLLMENLKSQGWQMLERKEPMGAEHIALAIRELAKFHSLSFALKVSEPQTYARLTGHLGNYFQNYRHIEEGFLDNARKKLAAVREIAKEHQEALIQCERDLPNLMDEGRDERDHLVIVHGDPWCNNMLFKYDNKATPSSPTAVCFLDWQISMVRSPALDLQYFLFLSAPKDVLDKYEELLRLYHETVRENLESMGYDIDFSYENLKLHWAKYAKIGFVTACGNLALLLRDEGQTKSLAECAEKGGRVLEEFFNADEITEEYRRRIRDLISSLVQHNCL